VNILVTGGMGFVGSHLVDQLVKEKHKITIVTKSQKKRKNILSVINKVIIKKCNIINFSKLGKIIDECNPDLIIHLAGITSHSKSFDEPLHDIDSSAKSTLFILEKIRKDYPKCKFILGSTFIVIGKPRKLPVNEDSECNPTTIYGANRLASENYCKIFHKVYGIDTRIFRITNSFGPREQIIPKKNAVNFLINEALKTNNITIFNEGEFFRDLIYISDVISGIRKIIKKGKAGELYWIASGKKTWFYHLGSILQKETNCKIRYVETPSYTKKVDVGNFYVNNSKLRELGWSPKITLRDGIKKTLKFLGQ
jgi:UDP-glucose 4-epimerase|tara:strand:- start:139 stop:1068 length:930 start_codon:yes stop_codon:yes gene_type:complete